MSNQKPSPKRIQPVSKETLEDLYISENLPVTKISKKLGVSNATVERWLKHYSIPIKNRKIIKPSKEVLQHEYEKYGSTISKLARQYETSNPTVRKWLKEYNIELKGHKKTTQEYNSTKSSPRPSKEDLEYYYHYYSNVRDLSKHFHTQITNIPVWLKELGINTKDNPMTEGWKRKWNKWKPTKEEVETIYNQYKNQKATASHFQCSMGSLRRLFEEYDITTIFNQRSQKEIELFEWCKSKRPDVTWIPNDRSVNNPYELDIYSPDLNLAIEYNGTYWHSESGPNKTKPHYHQEKWKIAHDKGIRLITVFSNDNMEKVKNLISHIIIPSKRIGARKCVVQKLDPKVAGEFHRKWHIHNSIGGSYHYGLYYEGEILQVCSFSKSRYNKKYDYECARNTVGGVPVQGGSSKLFKAFRNEVGNVSIISYADLRFGFGEVYKHCGLEFRDITKPNYWYFDQNNENVLLSRVKFQKHKLKNILPLYDPNKTEYQNMLDNDYDRVYDCGNAIWTT